MHASMDYRDYILQLIRVWVAKKNERKWKKIQEENKGRMEWEWMNER